MLLEIVGDTMHVQVIDDVGKTVDKDVIRRPERNTTSPQ